MIYPLPRQFVAKRHLKQLMLLLGILFALSISPAEALDKASMILQKMDKDNDGQISAAEWTNPPKAFKQIDSDGNGYVSLAELQSKLGGDADAAPAPANSPSPIPALYFVDAHSQMDGLVDEARILSLMQRGGIHRTLLSAQKGRSWQEIANFSVRYPEQITAAAVVKGGGYHGGDSPQSEFINRMNEEANSADINAMAEVLVQHDGLGIYYNIEVPLNDKLVQLALAKAKQRQWPFIIHIEFAGLSEPKKTSYLQQLDALLTLHPNHPFALIHMGLLQASEVRPLLEKHPNLFFLTSATNSLFTEAKPRDGSAGKPFVNIFNGPAFKPEWRQLFIDYSEHFIFALDCANNMHWVEKPYLTQMRRWWSAMQTLPPNVAASIAHANAERLWRLPPRMEGGMLPPDAALAKYGPVTGYAADRPF